MLLDVLDSIFRARRLELQGLVQEVISKAGGNGLLNEKHCWALATTSNLKVPFVILPTVAQFGAANESLRNRMTDMATRRLVADIRSEV